MLGTLYLSDRKLTIKNKDKIYIVIIKIGAKEEKQGRRKYWKFCEEIILN